MSGVILKAETPVRQLTDRDFEEAAAFLNVPQAAVRAFAEVESPAGAYLADGRPTILYEAHVFHALTGGKYASAVDYAGVPISVPNWNKSLYGAAGDNQYRRLEKAMSLDTDAALKSASWGQFQILGRNAEMVGYPNVREFVTDQVRGVDGQLNAFLGFIVANGIAPHLRNLPDQRAAERAAEIYNGPGYKANAYDAKIIKSFNKWATQYPPGNAPSVKPVLREGDRGPWVTRVQQALGVGADGIFGPATKRAVVEFQQRHGLSADGIVGPATYNALGLK